MSQFRLTYGKQLQSIFLDAGEGLVDGFQLLGASSVSRTLNTAFFGGGVLAPKSFTSLFSLNYPVNPLYIEHGPPSHITIGKERSYSVALGLVEAIPVIGTVVAIFNTFYHLYSLYPSYCALKKAVVELKQTERTDYNVDRGACCSKTKAVFEAAVNYTMHRNLLTGSLLGLIPWVKPITLLAQGIIFNLNQPKQVAVQE